MKIEGKVKMKIGIMSVFQVRTINYGNNLQAYALNYYLNNVLQHDAWTICMQNSFDAGKPKITSFYSIFQRFIKRILRVNKSINKLPDLESRYEKFAEFSRGYIKYVPEMNWKKICHSNYDCFIAGSDIVWRQEAGLIRRANFLDFPNLKSVDKISYAASFGKDWIPKENRRYIRKFLKDYKYISVRESSTVALLEDLNLGKAVHVLDPTLLLSASEWQGIERCPNIISEKIVNNKKFAFVYLLAADESVYVNVKKICDLNDLKIVSIPYMNSMEDGQFGDVQILDCSPQEWIWLAHHAELVLTDSFHGIVFSTIFQKKFLVTERKRNVGMNNRVADYLALIKQEDKLLSNFESTNLEAVLWDYKLIDKILEEKKDFSRSFLEKALSCDS